MKISQSTIDSIHRVTNIADVISDFVSLKKRGNNFWAPCPFHDENTPSFSVSPTKGFYKCFGCDAKGDAITFLRELEGMSFVDAILYLAKKYSIEVQQDETLVFDLNKEGTKESLYIFYNFAKDYFISNLHNTKEGQEVGLRYLKDRNIDISFIKKFELGLSLNIWEGLIKHSKKHGYSEKFLKDTGLIKNKAKSTIYDMFRDRLIFPIHNVYGKVQAIAGRIIIKKQDAPKYINSPETLIYNKGSSLYGLFQGKKQIKEKDCCHIVEGYTDVISMHIAGIENVVASGGTSLTENQIKLIKRFTNNVIILFDGDIAGALASTRSIDMILSQGMNVKVIVMPHGEDPDSYSKKVGADEFSNYLKKNIQDFVTFKAQLLNQEIENDPIKRAGIIKDIVKSIFAIPDIITRSIFIKSCSKVLQIEEEVLNAELNRLIINRSDKNNKLNFSRKRNFVQINEKLINASDGITSSEKEIISLILKYGKNKLKGNVTLAEYMFRELEGVSFTSSQYKDLYNLIKSQYLETKEIPIQFLINHNDSNIKNTTIDLISDTYEISKQWEAKSGVYIQKEKDNLGKSAYCNILRLKLKITKNLIIENQKKFEKKLNVEEVEELLHVHDHLKKIEKDIAAKLGIVIIGK